MSDLLHPLLDTIETVRGRISNHKPYLDSEETRTRVSLVDPILQALGWDPSDPEYVGLEWKIEQKSADYALLSEDRKPLAIVEAKRLGKSLGGMDQLGQIGMYALGGGARFVTLTNGDEWHLYDLRNVQSDGGVVFKVRLSTGQPEELAVQLLTLWRPHLCRNYRKAPEPARRQREHAPPPVDDGWVSLPDFQGKKNVKPLSPVRLPDDSELEVKHWKDLLTGVVRWLVDKGSLSANRLPVPLGPNHYLINTEHRHPTDKVMDEPVEVTTNIWVQTWGNQQTIRDNTARVLSHCGEDPRRVRLRKRS